MPDYLIKEETLVNIADAIRTKTGSSEEIDPANMASVISQIETVEGSGGFAEFNIAYGDTAPEDTSKLWVKCNEPDAVEVISRMIVASGEVEGAIGTLPKAASNIATATVGTKIYLFGGEYGVSSFLNTINVFDTETNTIETLTTTLPTVVGHAAAVAVGTKIYIFGGCTGDITVSSSYRSTINVFDTETNTIETLSATLPNGTDNLAAAAVGTDIYLFGGNGNLSAINVFDTETDTISTLKSSSTISGDLDYAVAIGSKIYVFGDFIGSTIDVFDLETTEVSTISTDIKKPASSAFATVGTKIYLFGGVCNGLNNTIQVFDAETNTLELLDVTLPDQIAEASGAIVNGTKMYILGGRNGGRVADVTSTIHAYIIKLPLAENKLLIESTIGKNTFNLISTNIASVEVGVNNVYLGNAEGYAEKVPALLRHVESGVEGEYPNSNCVETSAGTELFASINCAIGDLIVSAIATRDTLTISDGWTLLSTSEINSTDTAGNGQRLSFAYKFAESESESITVTQASEQRLYINMVVLAGATNVIDNGYTYENNEVSSITIAKPSRLTLWACSAPLWNTSSPYGQWEIDNGSYRIDLGNATQSRLAIFLDQSNSEEVTFTPDSTGTTIIIGSLTVEGTDYLYTEIPYTRNVWVEI
jgi:N-acetylneuraminic acid mutarotase